MTAISMETPPDSSPDAAKTPKPPTPPPPPPPPKVEKKPADAILEPE